VEQGPVGGGINLDELINRKGGLPLGKDRPGQDATEKQQQPPFHPSTPLEDLNPVDINIFGLAKV
jgi:hypothetical protein